MYKRHEIGRLGEKLAIKYLKQNNYKIIQQNFRCKQGEIDIIANNEGKIIFIEVKTRTNLKFGRASEAVTYIKKNHIVKTAKYYLYINNIKNFNIRIDVIEIYISSNKYEINHIKQVI